jgi:hypothetical protein
MDKQSRANDGRPGRGGQRGGDEVSSLSSTACGFGGSSGEKRADMVVQWALAREREREREEGARWQGNRHMELDIGLNRGKGEGERAPRRERSSGGH